MEELIHPNSEKHQFVIGIDFGHGETSAALCPIEWNVAAGESSFKRTDVRINPANKVSEKVVVSAISQIAGQKPQIGENAFSPDQMADGANLRVCFKEPPKSLDGENEQLMISFMRSVYSKIREMQTELTDDNHIVYIARPSGWTNPQQKELYCQMAQKAGIPLAGLTSESRAAIFYALNDPRVAFKQEIQNGAIVADLGSSTLDFTYLSMGEKPVDFGYNAGASIVERVIFEDKILPNKGVQALLSTHPQYKNALIYYARTVKENVYSKSDMSAAIDMSFLLRNVISKDCSDYNTLKNEFVIVEYENVKELNRILEEKAQYLTLIKSSLEDFRDHHIPGKNVFGVFLTGGASRMGFVRELISETYHIPITSVRLDPDNPSLTISRGIAMLGRADAISYELQEKLREETNRIDYAQYVSAFSTNLTDGLVNNIWSLLCIKADEFRKASTDLRLQDLLDEIEKALKDTVFEKSIKDALAKTITDKTNLLREELNQIIAIYSPGTSIAEVEVKDIDVDIEGFNEFNTLLHTEIMDAVNGMSTLVEVLLFSIFSSLLIILGLVAVIWEFVSDLFKSEEEKAARDAQAKKEAEEKRQQELQMHRTKRDREKIYRSILKNKDEITSELKKTVVDFLASTSEQGKKVISTVEPLFEAYTKSFIDKNIEMVKIPIE